MEIDPLWSMIDELEKESDRGAVLVAAAFLDDSLSNLLRSVMVDDKNLIDSLLRPDGPLGTFSARIKVCQAFGLLESDVYHDLQLIRRLRNEFAHRHQSASLEDPSARDRISNFQSQRRLPPPPREEPISALWYDGHPRERLRWAVSILCQLIDSRAEGRQRPKLPDSPIQSPGWDQI